MGQVPSEAARLDIGCYSQNRDCCSFEHRDGTSNHFPRIHCFQIPSAAIIKTLKVSKLRMRTMHTCWIANGARRSRDSRGHHFPWPECDLAAFTHRTTAAIQSFINCDTQAAVGGEILESSLMKATKGRRFGRQLRERIIREGSCDIAGRICLRN